ncbi:MAG TPA: DinB family protein, partial [Gemmatimonadota bacterium]|nr:DinB family protein [Gemmatimonadota bacterium]
LDWKPADKSMTLSRLATHLAELTGWGLNALKLDELDVQPPDGEPFVATQLRSVEEILELFDANLAKFRDALDATSDEAFMEPWTLKAGGQEIFTLPRVAVVRSIVLNHIVHHRGQLTVFLRLCGVPLPGTYGPSADDNLGMG